MNARLMRFSLAISIFLIIGTAAIVWLFMGSGSPKSHWIVWGILAPSLVTSGGYALAQLAFIVQGKYSECSEEEKEAARDLTDDCYAATQGESGWDEMLRSRM